MSRRKRTERWEDEHGTWEETVETDYDYDYSRRPRLRRNKIDGILGGVCAGLGDWLGIDHGPMRIFFVLAVIYCLPVDVFQARRPPSGILVIITYSISSKYHGSDSSSMK